MAFAGFEGLKVFTKRIFTLKWMIFDVICLYHIEKL